MLEVLSGSGKNQGVLRCFLLRASACFLVPGASACHVLSAKVPRCGGKRHRSVPLVPSSTLHTSATDLVRPCLPAAVADRPDPPACRASEVHEAPRGRNGHRGRPIAILAGRLFADFSQVHDWRSATRCASSVSAVRVPRRRPRRNRAGSSPGRAKGTFCLRNAALLGVPLVPSARSSAAADPRLSLESRTGRALSAARGRSNWAPRGR